MSSSFGLNSYKWVAPVSIFNWVAEPQLKNPRRGRQEPKVAAVTILAEPQL